MGNRYSVLPRVAVQQGDWNALVDASADAWLWHRWELIEAMSTWPSREDRSLVVVDNSGGMCAVLPIHLVRSRRSRIVPYRILDSMGGIAFDPSLSGKSVRTIQLRLVEEMDAMAKTEAVVETQVAVSPLTPSFRPPKTPRINPLLALGFRDASTVSWLVTLGKDKDEIWAGLQGRARTAIRKATREGVTIRTADPSDLHTYYRLHLETCRRKGLRPHPETYFRAIFDLTGHGLARIWLAELGKEAVAAGNFGWYKRGAWYWTGASSLQGLQTEANSLLHWNAISHMCDTGVELYETGEAFLDPSDQKLHRISEFKRSFGGDLLPIFRGRRDHRPIRRHILDLSGALRRQGLRLR